MHVTRIGFTPLKGGRHVEHPSVEIGPAGPVGDRVLCLVDPARDRVLRTVDNPALLRAVATLHEERLSVALDGQVASCVPVPTAELRKVDYWGRNAEVELLGGPWTQMLSRLLGREVALARPTYAGDVVYGGAVSLVTTASLEALSGRAGGPVEGARFRPTFVVDAGPLAAGDEVSWVGREVAIGSAIVRIRATVPRCAVVDLEPVSGRRDLPVLRALAGYGRAEGALGGAQGDTQGPEFGLDADVVRPGHVFAGDPLVVGRS